MKELTLIIAIIVSLILIFTSLHKLSSLYKEGRISAAGKTVLTYLVILVPVLGFLLTIRASRKDGKQYNF